jgi:heptosyltransferase I
MRGNRYLHWIDRYIGIPLIACLRPFHRCRELPHQIESIALLKSAAIGDTVLLSAIIYDLQTAFPSAKITFFAGLSNYEMAQLILGIEVLPITQLRSKAFSLWIDCDSWPRINALLSFFSRSAYRIGFNTPHQYRHFLYDLAIAHRSDRHELENYRDLLRALCIPTTHLPKITLPDAKTVEKRVALHLYPGGSRAKEKMWSESSWRELMSFLKEKGYEVVLTGGAKDRVALDAFSEGRNAAGLSLRQTAELLLSSHCVVSVDTGIMHLAAALGCRVIALHGPTSPTRWGAIGPHVTTITPPPPYTPTISLGFETSDTSDCSMESISSKRIKESVDFW